MTLILSMMNHYTVGIYMRDWHPGIYPHSMRDCLYNCQYNGMTNLRNFPC